MIYSRQSLHTLKNLVNPVDILTSIGNIPHSSIMDYGTEIRCPCPLHGGDQITGFSWKKAEGLWSCFTKRCGEDTGQIRDVYGFIMLKQGLSFAEAADTLASMYGFSLEQGDVSSYSELHISSKFKRDCQRRSRYQIEKLEELQALPGYCTSDQAAEYFKTYLNSRGYHDLEALYPFNLYPCLDVKGNLRVGIPSYDEDNRLVGVNSRRMDGVLSYPPEEPKYRMISGYKKGAVLYNLNNAKQYSQQRGLIVVEGEFSAIRLVTYGIPNVIGTMGNIISTKQLPLIYKHAYHLIFLIEEGDAALQGVYKSIENLIPNSMKVSISKLPSGDPDDNTKNTVVQVLENSVTLSNDNILNIKDGKRIF